MLNYSGICVLYKNLFIVIHIKNKIKMEPNLQLNKYCIIIIITISKNY